MWEPLATFLPAAAKRTGQAPQLDASRIVEVSAPVITQIIPELRPVDFRVISYRDGTLTLATASPVVTSELRLRQEPILQALRESLGERPLISRLRFVPMPQDEDEA